MLPRPFMLRCGGCCSPLRLLCGSLYGRCPLYGRSTVAAPRSPLHLSFRTTRAAWGEICTPPARARFYQEVGQWNAVVQFNDHEEIIHVINALGDGVWPLQVEIFLSDAYAAYFHGDQYIAVEGRDNTATHKAAKR